MGRGKNIAIYIFYLAIFGIVAAYFSVKTHNPWVLKASIEQPATMESLASAPNSLPNWPPKVGEAFPNIRMHNHQGKPFSVESLLGKLTLVEMVAMTCAGCQAFSGGNIHGGFGGLPAQAGLKSIQEYFYEYTGGLSLHDSSMNFVQIVIYNTRLGAPTSEEIAAWQKHFKLDKQKNTFVLTGGEALANKDSFRMIPGFLLLDKAGVVQFDATGHTPQHNLYRDLLPAVRKFL